MDDKNLTEQQPPAYTPPPYRPGQGYSIHLTFGEILADKLRSRLFLTFTVIQTLFFLVSALFFREQDGVLSFFPLINPVSLVFSVSAILLIAAAKRAANGSMSVGVLIFLRISCLFFAVVFALAIALSYLFFFFPGLLKTPLPYPLDLLFKNPICIVLLTFFLFSNILAFYLFSVTAQSVRDAVKNNARPEFPPLLPLLLFAARLPAAPLFFLSLFLRECDGDGTLSVFYLGLLIAVSLLGLLRLLLFSFFFKNLVRASQSAYFPQK